MKQCLVVSGPSGSGKSTLLNRLFKKYPASFGFSVSHTTRNPRPGETKGVSYHYIERKDFEGMIKSKKFVEYAEFSGNYYGTSIDAIEAVKRRNQICVLDLEVHGVQSIKRTKLSCKFVFLQPPSLQVLEQRLRDRKTETEESLQKRIASAKEAMDYAALPGSYDKIITNDVEDDAYVELEEFVLKNWDLNSKKSKICLVL